MERLKALLDTVTTECDRNSFGAKLLLFREHPEQGNVDVTAVLNDESRLDRVTAAVRGAFEGHHDRLAFATQTTWAPGAADELRPAWLAIIVARSVPPIYVVKRIVEDQTWFRLPADQAPEFATSTAQSLVRALDGVPMPPIRFGLGPTADRQPD